MIEYRYRPQGPVLERYIQSRTRRTFIMGPLGSSKTNASCWKGFRIMCDQAPDADGVRRTRLAATRNTYPDLMGTTVKDWLEMFGGLGRFTKGGLEPPTHRLRFALEDGTSVESEMVFIALDREDDVRKLRGLQLTAAWVNETKEIPYSIVDMLDLRVGRYPNKRLISWFGIFGDTNAPDEDHWYYRMAEEEKPEGWLFLRQPGGVTRDSAEDPWRVNPLAENLGNLVDGYYSEGVQGKREDWIKVNLANEYGFVQDGKPIYPEYVDSLHCKEFALARSQGLYIGMDFGLTPAATIAQRTPNGRWLVDREVVSDRMGAIRFARELKRVLEEFYPGWAVHHNTGDPAGNQGQAGDHEERTIFQIMAAEGVMAMPAHTNEFSVRREAVAQLLSTIVDGTPGLLIHPRCKILRKGMAGRYMFERLKVSGDARFRDKPLKNEYSHVAEALQYCAMGGGEGRAILRGKNPRKSLDYSSLNKAIV